MDILAAIIVSVVTFYGEQATAQLKHLIKMVHLRRESVVFARWDALKMPDVKNALCTLIQNIEVYDFEEQNVIAEMVKHDRVMIGNMILSIVKQVDRKNAIPQLNTLFCILEKDADQLAYETTTMLRLTKGKDALQLAISNREMEIQDIFLEEIYKCHCGDSRAGISFLKQLVPTNEHSEQLIERLRRKYDQTMISRYFLPLAPVQISEG